MQAETNICCDFCEATVETAWRYPGDPDAFTACDECHLLIQRGDRRGLAKRAARMEGSQLDLEFLPLPVVEQITFLEEVFEFFWDNWANKTEPMRLLGPAVYHQIVFFQSRDALNAATEAVLSLFRNVDCSLDIHGKRLGKHAWQLEIRTHMPTDTILRQLGTILQTGKTAA